MTLKFYDDGSGNSYTAMGVPPQLSTSNVTSNSADLTLPTGVTGAQYYELSESTNNGASWTVVDSAIAPSSIVSPATYSRSGLTSGVTYQWRLRAKFASLVSPLYSAVMDVVLGSSGGTPALSYSSNSRSIGAILTITTDGTYNFGGVGPELICLIDPSTATSGDLLLSDIVLGSGVSAAFSSGTAYPNFKTASDANMPGGRGIIMGAVGSGENPTQYPAQLEVTHNFYSRLFEHRSTYWPSTNQVNSIPDLDTNNIWQIKPIWNMSNGDFGNTGTNFFFNPSYDFDNTASILAFKKGEIVNSNSVPTIYAATDIRNDSDQYYRPYAAPYCFGSLYDLGTGNGSTDGTADVTSSARGHGMLEHETKTGIQLSYNGSYSNNNINGFHYPGYIRGFNIGAGMNFLEGAIYKAGGPGAACRVAITDNADYYSSNLQTILEVIYWSSTTIKVKIRNSWWDFPNWSGKYINIIGADNTQIGSVQL